MTTLARTKRNRRCGAPPAFSPQAPGTWKPGRAWPPRCAWPAKRQAYTLSDRATYLSLQQTLRLRLLFAGDPVLRNPYSVMLVNPARHPRVNAAGARAFHAWLLGEEARALIARYGVERFGQPLFVLDPLP
ncbi:MAG: hypothetical protein KatS3mg131_3914 [Candidatus Tectimicrobiota bacterium]|nr:MAG: hypothetical protein KatS3mg131_3914 [Candidatus Tectomicrobia bacterium]